jgi:hypothetical protein
MPSMPFPGSWQVKNGRLFLATTEVPPSSDWCNKQEIQAVAATIQRLFRRQLMPGKNRRLGVMFSRKCAQVHDMFHAVSLGRID